MELYLSGKLNPEAFASAVRKGTHDLDDVMQAVLATQSPSVECGHFLIALSQIPDGVTQNALDRLGLSAENWRSGLSRLVDRSSAPPPPELLKAAFHLDTRKMLEEAQELCLRDGVISEGALLLCGLRNVPAPVASLLNVAHINRDEWCREIEQSLQPTTAVQPFSANPSGPLILKAFTPCARKVVGLMRTEAESLGYSLVDARHLILALVEREKGVTQYGLFHQGITPRRVQEAVILNLRGGARRTRTELQLKREEIQPLLRQIFTLAGEIAGRDHRNTISDVDLLRAFLATSSAARSIIEDEKVDVVRLRQIAEKYDVPDNESENDNVADTETVRKRLQDRLVGQDEAIEQILPYVQRMRFGFTTPGRPVGTFLFCGQSGSGKTEMAKELARAIYGSEENLVFLEMGQFNSPESMNIFVGAPPGYIGYGEGKLTNGLRDKPTSVVLFDEVEKAHIKVLDALLRFLDEGKIDDPAGPVRDGSQCILILTSNLGAEELSKLRSTLDKEPNRQARIRSTLRETFRKAKFRVEFLNRIEELILFRTLDKKDYIQIAQRLLKRDLARLADVAKVHVVDYTGVPEAIGEYCDAAEEGARAVQRLTQKVVVTPVIDFLVRGRLTPPVRLKVSARLPGRPSECEPIATVSIANEAEKGVTT